MTPDARGDALPTAIASVPHPGSRPDDPLYFVTELRGTVKVVTNDRTVHTFATTFFQLVPAHELPAWQGCAARSSWRGTADETMVAWWDVAAR